MSTSVMLARPPKCILIAIVIWIIKIQRFKCLLMPDSEYKYRDLPLLSHFCCFCCNCPLFLESSSFLPSSFKLCEFQVRILLPMVPLSYPRINKIVSTVTLTSLQEAFPDPFFLRRSITFELRIPMNGLLLSFAPTHDLVDAQFKRMLVFYLKQINYGLSLSLIWVFSLCFQVFLGHTSDVDPKFCLVHESRQCIRVRALVLP